MASAAGSARRVDLALLPSRIGGAQAEEGLAGSLHVSRQGGAMLHGHVNIAKVALERVPFVDGVGAGGMEDQVDASGRPRACRA